MANCIHQWSRLWGKVSRWIFSLQIKFQFCKHLYNILPSRALGEITLVIEIVNTKIVFSARNHSHFFNFKHGHLAFFIFPKYIRSQMTNQFLWWRDQIIISHLSLKRDQMFLACLPLLVSSARRWCRHNFAVKVFALTFWTKRIWDDWQLALKVW